MKRNFGNHIPFCFLGNYPIFTIGPDWKSSLGSLSVTLVAAFLLLWYEKDNEEYFSSLLKIGSVLLFLFVLTALLNPGIASSSEPALE